MAGGSSAAPYARIHRNEAVSSYVGPLLDRRTRELNSGFVLRLLINAAALWVATRVVPGVTYSGGWIAFFGVALVFGVVNTFVGFTAKILTFPLIVFTLGLFILVINGLMLWLTSGVSNALGLGFRVEGFWPAFWGALVVTIVSTALGIMTRRPHVVVHHGP
jgi:putative membrane protein